VDLAQHLTGESITSVSALTETFIRERPLAAAADGLAATASADKGPVTVDDAALFLARLSGGGIGTFEASRFATGRKNGLRIELNGERASVAFDLERLNELEIYDTAEGTEAGPRRVLVTESDHPYLDGWWPPGHVLGWEHSFVHEVRDLLAAIAAGDQPRPSFDDGLAVQRVLGAVESSAADRRWVDVAGGDAAGAGKSGS
jgi:predicted dehydrogenase